MQVGGVVPEPDDVPLALVPELADRGGAEREVARVGGGEVDPARAEHAQDVAVGEQRDVAAASSARAITRSARSPTWSSVSPPGTPSRHRYQPGRRLRISSVVRPSYSP